MNLALLCLIGAAWPRPALSEPGAGSSIRTSTPLILTPEDVGLGPTPKEQARMEREMTLPGPPNRQQKREAARSARRAAARRMR